MNEPERLFRMVMLAANGAALAAARGDTVAFARFVEKHRIYAHRYRRAAAMEPR